MVSHIGETEARRIYDPHTVGKYHELQRRRIGPMSFGWHFTGLYDGEKMADLSPTVFVRSANEAFIYYLFIYLFRISGYNTKKKEK